MLVEMNLVFYILLLAVLLLVSEVIPVALTAIIVVILLEITGILTTAEAFSGFSNSTVILFAAMFVVGKAVFKTGLASFLGKSILELVGNRLRSITAAISVISALMSALLSNTGTTATLMPLVGGISSSAGLPSSKLLMPMAFTTSLGGMMTVIGTPPNIIVNGILEEYGIEPFGFIEFGKVGAFICLAGIIYLVFFYDKISRLFPSQGEGKEQEVLESSEVKEERNVTKMWFSGLILFFVCLVMILDLIPLHLAAVIGAVLSVLTGCLSMQDAYRGIDWNTIFLFAGMLPLSLALEKTGGAELIADLVMNNIADSSLLIVLSAVFLITMLLSQFMSNTASAALLAPIGLSIASGMGISPYPVLMTVAMAGSAAFLTPMATPPNTMVFGEGGYRVLDYFIAGLPLIIISYLITVLMVPLFFPA